MLVIVYQAQTERFYLYKFLYCLICPESVRDHPLIKMHPECLKLVSIIQKCKLEQAILTSENVVGKEGEDAFIRAYVRRKNRRFRTKIPRKRLGRPRAKRAALEKNLGSSYKKFARVDALGKVLKRGRILYI